MLRAELDALNVTLDERRLRHLASNLVSHVALREVYDGPIAPDEAVTLPYGVRRRRRCRGDPR